MGSHEIVGELFHDHEIVRNVKYSSLWDNLGMSDIMPTVKRTYRRKAEQTPGAVFVIT